MNRLRYLALAVMLLGCFVSPSISTASPVYYTASGSLVDNQGGVLQINGGVYIDDQLRDVSGQPTGVIDLTGVSFYNYYITGYSLNIGEYSFSGNDGWLWTPLIRYPTLEDWDFHDLMWSLGGGDANSQWTEWIGESFTFCNLDGTPQDASQYCSLASTIDLSVIDLVDRRPRFESPIFANLASFNIHLVQNGNSSPVPEPTAIVLFGAGLLATALKRKKRPGNQESAGDAVLP